MNDRYALRLSLQSLDGVNKDYRGLIKEGLQVDSSYMAMRLGNWSASMDKVYTWWSLGWDGNYLKFETSLGWEEISVSPSAHSDSGFTFSASVSKHFKKCKKITHLDFICS